MSLLFVVCFLFFSEQFCFVRISLFHTPMSGILYSNKMGPMSKIWRLILSDTVSFIRLLFVLLVCGNCHGFDFF